MHRASLVLLTLMVSVSACGGSKPAAEQPEQSAAATEGSDAPAAADEKSEGAAPAEGTDAAAAVPTKCAKAGSVCTPSFKFTQKLCAGSYPGMALYLFANNSPWTRGYLTRRTKAWNASGGVSAENAWLEFDEEVLVLQERKADTGGMQVSGSGGGYDVLRWDGTCATLSGEELTMNKPPAAKTPRVEWRFLDDNVQEALRADEEVSSAVTARKKECKGATSGEVSMKCVKADEKLSVVIIGFVRKGGSVPVPTKLPE
ncbi:MAG TPA: hypothetical protein VM686_06050 [Polyangiaceae bacterium]|nr:hypothetical protein [Polyangiaceae bacterium]